MNTMFFLNRDICSAVRNCERMSTSSEQNLIIGKMAPNQHILEHEIVKWDPYIWNFAQFQRFWVKKRIDSLLGISILLTFPEKAGSWFDSRFFYKSFVNALQQCD